MSEQDTDDSETGNSMSGSEEPSSEAEPTKTEQDPESENGVPSAGEGEPIEEFEQIAEEPDAAVETVLSKSIENDDSPGTEPGSSGLEGTHVEVTDGLVAELERTEPERIGKVLTGFLTRLERTEEQLEQTERELKEQRERAEDLESRLTRKQADFENYKKRQQRKLEEEKERATEDLVSRLVEIRDNLKRALDQEEGTDIRGGVETTLAQFDKELERENVAPIEPEPGQETDPTRHEVLATVAGGNPEGTIETVHRPGYEMAGKVIQTAQVAVSDGSANEEPTEGDGTGSGNTEADGNSGAKTDSEDTQGES